jgi:RimJ/RimL family protein N-acetyltransferase
LIYRLGTTHTFEASEMPSPTTDPWRSARLRYRAVDPQTDTALFRAINEDHLGYANSNASNIHLPDANDAVDFQKHVSEALLGAVICVSGEDNGTVDTPIGHITLKALPPRLQHHRHTEIGIDILPPFQGKGYGSEAIQWALDYAFRRAGLHRVSIRAFGWNEGAIRLYQRLGFTLEGKQREDLWHEGRWWDGFEFGMLEQEWRDMHKE